MREVAKSVIPRAWALFRSFSTFLPRQKITISIVYDNNELCDSVDGNVICFMCFSVAPPAVKKAVRPAANKLVISDDEGDIQISDTDSEFESFKPKKSKPSASATATKETPQKSNGQ